MSYSTIARWGTTLLILVLLFGPSIVQIGEFFDGVTYAGIARQLSLGMGDLWAPSYSPFLSPEFFGHLPVWLGWHSVFFRVLGDHWWVDGVFQMVNLALTLGAMYWLWREVWESQPSRSRPNFQVVIWLWLTVPIVLWTYRNNLLEVGVNVFALVAVAASFRAVRGQSKLSLMVWSAMAALMTLGAMESKGVVGLFPLATGAVFFIFHDKGRGRATVFLVLTMCFFVVFLGAMFWIVPETLVNVKQHLQIQLFPALEGELDITTGWRGKILFEGLLHLLPVVFLTACWAWRRPFVWTRKQKQIFWSLVGIGLLASLPLCISFKQRTFYLIPSMPYFVMAASVFWSNLEPFKRISKKAFTRLRWGWWAGMVAALMFLGSIFGNISRDKAKWEIAIQAANEFEPGTVFFVSTEMVNDYALIACFVRTGSMYISDHPSESMTHEIRAIQVDQTTRYVISPLSE